MKAVIFDFNGTMVFDNKYHDLAWKEFSKRIRGYAFSDDEINRHVHAKVNEQIIYYLKKDIDEEENKKLSLEKEAVYREMCLKDIDNYKLVKGLGSYMDYLKEKNIPFTIASASIKPNIDFFVDVFSLDKWIDPEKIVYDDGSHADKKTMFLEAAKRINVDIKDCIIFEDSFIGAKCAYEIGAGMVIAIPIATYREEFEKNEAIAFTIEDYSDTRLREVI